MKSLGPMMLLLFCVSVLTAQTSPSSSPDAVINDYFNYLKTGDLRKAVGLWSADTMLKETFGLTYLELPKEDRQRAQLAFTRFIAAPYAMPKVKQLFRSIEFTIPASVRLDANNALVRVKVEGADKGFQSESTMLVRRFANGWRIVDQKLVESNLSIRPAIAQVFLGGMKHRAETIPDVLERVVEGMAQNVEKARAAEANPQGASP